MLRFFMALLAICSVAAAPRGTVLFETNFEQDEPALKGTGKLSYAPGHDSKRSLLTEVPLDARSRFANLSLPLPVEKMRGCLIHASAFVKAQDVSKPPQPWNGVKFMLVIKRANHTDYPNAPFAAGSFDWQRGAMSARIPADAESVTLVLGLEAVTGKAWFDDVKITVLRGPTTVALPKPQPGPMYKGHTETRLRGAMVGNRIGPEDVRVFGQEWKANLVRWQLIRSTWDKKKFTLADYDAWLEGELQKFDELLPWFEKHGIKVALDLHSPPGGRGISGGYAAANAGFFSDPAAQAKFVEVWKKMAKRYRHAKAIWGYDLANEPVEEVLEAACDDWQTLAEKTAREVRAIDPDHAIIIEPAQWGGPDGFRDLIPIDVPRVVYSVHVYVPHQFTHQNLSGKIDNPITYPGLIAGKQWDKKALEAAVQPVIDFQKRYNVHVYVGEFSAIRWAPGTSAHDYLRDLIEIFEKHDWDWSYHAFREWDGWSVEHGPDPKNHQRLSTPTDRQTLLRSWYARNR